MVPWYGVEDVSYILMFPVAWYVSVYKVRKSRMHHHIYFDHWEVLENTIHVDGQTQRQTDGRTDGQTASQIDRQTDRQANAQTDRQTHRQTDRQTDGKTDRQ